MMKKNSVVSRVVLVVVLALAGWGIASLINGPADNHPLARDMVFVWTEPVDGTPVVTYDVEIRKGGSQSNEITNMEVATNRVVFPVEWLAKYEVRVRGVDARGVSGPWSEWSDALVRDEEDPETPS